MKKTVKFIVFLLVFVLVASVAGCGKNGGKGSMVVNGIDFGIEGNEAAIEGYDTTNPVVAIYVEGYGVIVAELYPGIAPNTVNNFISLVKQGYYDGIIFHRVIENFMIQGGDPTGTGYGGPGYSIRGEFTDNGFENNLSHKRGVLSMARSKKMDSAGSQFFIVHVDYPYLDGQYASFGKVISGLDVVDKIAAVKTDGNDKPKKEVKMIKVIVDTKGVEYPEPVKM